MTAVLATLWAVLQHGILSAGALLGAGLVIMAVLRRAGRAGRRLAVQVRDVHAVILGDQESDPTRPSLIERLEHGDRRMARIEDDIKAVKDDTTEIQRRVESVEGFVDVLGSQERLEIRTAIARATDRGRVTDERAERRKPA